MAEEVKNDESELYYLKKGAFHNAVVNGNAREYSGDKGDGVRLSPGQYESFKDKFHPLGQKNSEAEALSHPEVTGLAPEPSAAKPAVAPSAVVTGDAKPAGAQPAKVDTAGDAAKK